MPCRRIYTADVFQTRTTSPDRTTASDRLKNRFDRKRGSSVTGVGATIGRPGWGNVFSCQNTEYRESLVRGRAMLAPTNKKAAEATFFTLS